MTRRRMGLVLSALLLLSLACKTLNYKGGLPADRETGQVNASRLIVRLEQVSALWSARHPLPADCVQQAGALRVAPGREGELALLRGCIAAADGGQPRLAARNPQKFYLSAGLTNAQVVILGPGEEIPLNGAAAGPAPLAVSAELSPAANLHSLVDLALVLLPGKHEIATQPEVVKCLAGNSVTQAELPELVIAAQSLANGDAENAAKSFTQALRDKTAAARLARAARRCDTAAQSWQASAIRQTGQVLFNEQARLEYALSALSGTREDQVVFEWGK